MFPPTSRLDLVDWLFDSKKTPVVLDVEAEEDEEKQWEGVVDGSGGQPEEEDVGGAGES